MDVPIDNGDAVDLLIFILSILCRDSDIVEETKPHRAFGRRVMSRRSDRDKRIRSFGLHNGIDTRARTARREQRSIERLHRNNGVRIKPVESLFKSMFDLLEMMWRMRGLDDSF